MTTLLISSTATLILLSYILFIRPRIRDSRFKLFQARLDEQVELFKTSFPQFDYSNEQTELRQNLLQLENNRLYAADAEKKARNISFPTLESPKPTESRNEVIDRITGLFTADSPITLGAEQIIYQIASSPEFSQQIIFAKEALASHLDFAGFDVSTEMHRTWSDLTHAIGPTLHNLGPSLHDLFQQLYQNFIDHPESIAKLFGNAFAVALNPNALNAVMFVVKELGDKPVAAAFSHAFPDSIGSVASHWEHASSSITDHAHSAVGSIIDHASSLPAEHSGIDFHFPIITLIFSAKREIALLNEKKTNLSRSLKNTGLDAAGTGGGALIGAKAGAFVGTTLAPGVGTIIGLLVGSIGGAIGGRFLTNKVKGLPLMRANDAYVSSYTQMEAETTEGAHQAARNIRATVESEHQRYLQNIGCTRRPEQLAKELVATEKLRASIAGSLHDVRSALTELRNTKMDSWYHYLLGVSVDKRAHLRWQQFIENADVLVAIVDSSLPSREQICVQPLTSLNTLASLPPMQYGQHAVSYRELIKEMHETLTSYSLQIVLWIIQAAACYQASMKKVADSVQTEGKSFVEICERWSGDVTALYGEVEREKRALGLS